MAERRFARCGGRAALPSASTRLSGTLRDREGGFPCLSSGQPALDGVIEIVALRANSSAIMHLGEPGREAAATAYSSRQSELRVDSKHASELAVPYWIDAKGTLREGTLASHPEGARRTAQASPF